MIENSRWSKVLGMPVSLLDVVKWLVASGSTILLLRLMCATMDAEDSPAVCVHHFSHCSLPLSSSPADDAAWLLALSTAEDGDVSSSSSNTPRKERIGFGRCCLEGLQLLVEDAVATLLYLSARRCNWLEWWIPRRSMPMLSSFLCWKLQKFNTIFGFSFWSW